MNDNKLSFRNALGLLILGAHQTGLSEEDIEDVILNDILGSHEVPFKESTQIDDIEFTEIINDGPTVENVTT